MHVPPDLNRPQRLAPVRPNLVWSDEEGEDEEEDEDVSSQSEPWPLRLL